MDKISSKPPSGRLTPPSCYSGGVGSKHSSVMLAGNNIDFNETGSVQMSNEQNTHERFIPMMHMNDRVDVDRFSVEKEKNRSLAKAVNKDIYSEYKTVPATPSSARRLTR